ncbi:MAG TPA: PQQ-binding-like beta-propeller repeat protein [Candidatus Dormibacteraeota bacterium]|nr:PQQ-binding-like beta-propeller repeat protein [Candidatus Dormibacteraeota bacterium]
MARPVSAVAVTVLATLAIAHAAPPALFRADARHGGSYPGAGVPALHGVKWKFKSAGPVLSSPAVAGGTLYFGSSDHQVYALDEKSGTLRWKFATHGRVTASPAVAGGRVYVGSFDGNFYALDAQSGALLWKFATEGERRFAARHLHGAEPAAETMPDPFDFFLSSPVTGGKLVYFGSGDGNVYALEAASGTLAWKFHTGNVVHASPALADGTLYVGSWDSYFYALDAASGKERWSYSNKGSWVISSPAVRAGTLYFATSDTGLVRALDAKSGAEVFALEFKHWPFFSSPTLAGNTLYIGSHSGKLVAIDLGSRQLAWSFATDGAQQHAAAYTKADGTPNYEAVFTDFFYDDMVSGVQRMMNVGAVLSTPVIDGDTVFFGSWDGQVYALN